MKIEMTLLDNGMTKLERAETLWYCERALCRVYRRMVYGETQVKLARWWAGFTAEVILPEENRSRFVRQYNLELMKLKAWNDPEEILIMEVDW